MIEVQRFLQISIGAVENLLSDNLYHNSKYVDMRLTWRSNVG